MGKKTGDSEDRSVHILTVSSSLATRNPIMFFWWPTPSW